MIKVNNNHTYTYTQKIWAQICDLIKLSQLKYVFFPSS